MFALTLCLAKAQPSEPQGTITGRAWLDMGGTGLADITGNDRKVKGELADKIKAALDAFVADFA